MTPPSQNAKLDATLTVILEYMQKRDQEDHQVSESLKVLPQLVTNVALLTEQIRRLAEVQADHEEILHGKGDEPGLVGKFKQLITDVDRMNGYVKAAVVVVMGSGLVMVAQLFLQHGSILKP